MRGSAVAYIKYLAQECADPPKAAKVMIQTGEKHVKLTKRQVTFITLDRLHSKGLGTEDVERGSLNLIKHKLRRDQGYINYVMGRRKRDALEKLEKARRLHQCSMQYLVSIVPAFILEEFRRCMKWEMGRDWQKLQERMKRKIRGLQDKYQRSKAPIPSQILGIKISDGELAEDEAREDLHEVKVYGNAVVPGEVRPALALDPKFAIHPRIDMKEVEMEVEKGIWKARWDYKSKELREGQVMTEQEEEREAEETRIYDRAEKRMNFSKLRVTQLPGNARVVAPAPLIGDGRSTELHLQHLKTRLMRVTAMHLQQEYDAQGRPKEANITIEERRSLKAVKVMEEAGVNQVRPADKANASVVDTCANYLTLMETHLKDDPVLSEKEEQRCVRECNGHGAFWRRILNLCEGHPTDDALGDRVTAAVVNDQNMLPPYMVGLAKTHKQEECYRPLCLAKNAPNNVLSWILAQYIGKVGEEATESRAVLSTEEVMAKFTAVNHQMRGRETWEGFGVGSLDIKSLYPSLTKEWVEKILSTMIMKTEVMVEEIDWAELGVYLATTHTQQELDDKGLSRVVPRWRHRPQGGGNRPGITGSRAVQGKKDDEEEEKSWLRPEQMPTEEEKQKMWAAAVVAGVLGAMNNHTYRFNQQTRRQLDGGSIGNVLTGEVADVVMAWWKGNFVTLASRATSHLIEQFLLETGIYVDDDFLVFEFLPPGTRWCAESKMMEVNQDLVEVDLEEKEDVRTMREVSKMADSICPVLKTTFDCPGLQESQKMPLLNLQVWVERVEQEGGGSEWEVLWEYYRKPCSTRTVMLARSAMSDRIKRSSLTQEAIQILRNCSRSLPWESRAAHLSDFSLRMKLSGYTAKYREAVITSALSAWEKQLELDRSGECPLYRPRSWRKDERSKKKEMKKQGWFRQLGGKSNDFALFCPSSPGGRLAEKWKQVVEEMRESSGGLIKAYVAEKTGVPISALLFNNQLGENDTCGKLDCNPCLRGTTKKLSCRKVSRGGMVYACNCLNCKQAVEVKESWYHGRTARTLYTRQGEHITGFEAGKEENALYKHAQLFHQGEVPEFQFEAEKFFSDATSAQIYEGVCINHTPSAEGYLMNSKAEYQQGQVARVVVMRGLHE